MPVIAYVFAFLLGLCVGSFLNVCIYRLPRAMSLLRPGSHCPTCNQPVAWYDNIPVLSWLRLRGLCRHCGVRISARYMLVELLTGAVFVWVLAGHAAASDAVPLGRLPALGAYAALASALIVASFVDIERMVIPDEVSVAGMYVGPVLCAVWPGLIVHDPLITGWILRWTGLAGRAHLGGLAASIVGMLVGAGIVYAAGRLGKVLFRKEAMGFGDVKLMGMVGAFVGWQGAMLAFFVACVVGAVVGVVLLIRRRNTHIPFGPYLAAGSLLVMLHQDILVRLFWDLPTLISPWR